MVLFRICFFFCFFGTATKLQGLWVLITGPLSVLALWKKGNNSLVISETPPHYFRLFNGHLNKPLFFRFEADSLHRSEYWMLVKRHLHGTPYGAIEQCEELHVHSVYYPVVRLHLSWNRLLPPSFLSRTLCIFFMFNKVLSVVTTCGCARGGFWWTCGIHLSQ